MILFDFYRRILMIVCCTYAAIRAAQAIIRWREQLGGDHRHMRVMRGYVTVLLVSTRIRLFGRELAHIVLLTITLAVLLYAHQFVL